MHRIWIIIALVAGQTHSQGEIVDSLVASVGSNAIKHSDVMREIRLTAFMNRETPAFTSDIQKQAVDRLVDQALIRQEIEGGMYVPDDPKAADSLFQQLRNSYGGTDAFLKALASRGLTEETLKKQLQWQSTVLRFIQIRFGGGTSGAPADAVNEAFFAWLDQMHKDRKIQIQEARLR